jgi:sporulation protein YlmC with PRC-barrel domain
MNTFDDLTDQTVPSLIGRKVVDSRGESIGTVDALWTDEATGKVEFIGVKTGWLLGKTHAVPARGAEIHDDGLWVPYDAPHVKDAPSYPAEEPLPGAQDQEVW